MNMTTWITKRWAQAIVMLAIVPMAYGLGGAVAWGTTMHGTVVVDDQFIDGGVSDGADLLDAEWVSFGPPVLSVQNDDGAGQLNGGNALLIDRSFNGVTGAVADLPSGPTQGRKLVSVGDYIKLEFDFRLTNFDLSTYATNRGFRGGFFNRNSNPGDTNDDKGYFFRAGVGNPLDPNALDLFVAQELGTDTNGIANGADFVSSPTGTMANAIDTADPRSLAFTLEKTATGVTATVDLGGTVVSGTFSAANGPAGAIDLDEFEFFGIFGSKRPWDIMVDNLLVTTNAPLFSVVPEPSSFALIALGLAAVGMRRRR